METKESIVEGGEKLRGRNLFLCFLRPSDERKSPVWSEVIRYDYTYHSVSCLHVLKHPSQLRSFNSFEYELKVAQEGLDGVN